MSNTENRQEAVQRAREIRTELQRLSRLDPSPQSMNRQLQLQNELIALYIELLEGERLEVEDTIY